jgi:5-formyltetrahydrofolate cyclo-ligase
MTLEQWRKAERARLLAIRQSLSVEQRSAGTAAIVLQLDALIPADSASIVGGYWPIRAEPDLRTWMRGRAEGGLRLALPVAVALGVPLKYREWHPGAPMAHGLWGIPYPADGAEVAPDIVLAPLVGYDPAGYRLGYGGGFFDRTLAAADPRPRALGVGYACGAMQTIRPQPHDIPMERIVVGSG